MSPRVKVHNVFLHGLRVMSREMQESGGIPRRGRSTVNLDGRLLAMQIIPYGEPIMASPNGTPSCGIRILSVLRSGDLYVKMLTQKIIQYILSPYPQRALTVGLHHRTLAYRVPCVFGK